VAVNTPIKGVVHLKKKKKNFCCEFTHPHVIQDVHVFLQSKRN